MSFHFQVEPTDFDLLRKNQNVNSENFAVVVHLVMWLFNVLIHVFFVIQSIWNFAGTYGYDVLLLHHVLNRLDLWKPLSLYFEINCVDLRWKLCYYVKSQFMMCYEILMSRFSILCIYPLTSKASSDTWGTQCGDTHAQILAPLGMTLRN